MNSTGNSKHKNSTSFAQGSAHPNAKFKELDIIRMRRLREAGLKNKEIAEIFNTFESIVCNIVNYKAWKHVKPWEW